jgi:hypothetical protein
MIFNVFNLLWVNTLDQFSVCNPNILNMLQRGHKPFCIENKNQQKWLMKRQTHLVKGSPP